MFSFCHYTLTSYDMNIHLNFNLIFFVSFVVCNAIHSSWKFSQEESKSSHYSALLFQSADDLTLLNVSQFMRQTLVGLVYAL